MKKQSRFNCSNSYKPRANEPFISFCQSAQLWILYTYASTSIIDFSTGWLTDIKRNVSVQIQSKSIKVHQCKKTEWKKKSFLPMWDFTALSNSGFWVSWVSETLKHLRLSWLPEDTFHLHSLPPLPSCLRCEVPYRHTLLLLYRLPSPLQRRTLNSIN